MYIHFVCVHMYITYNNLNIVQGKICIFFKGSIRSDLVIENERLHLISVFGFGRFRLLWHI